MNAKSKFLTMTPLKCPRVKCDICVFCRFVERTETYFSVCFVGKWVAIIVL